MALPTALVPLTFGKADVSWRSCSHEQGPFTSRRTVICMFRSHVQLLFTLGSESKLRDCEYIRGVINKFENFSDRMIIMQRISE